ncbi:chitinase endochitinase 1 precursor [Scheffersomyces coipomensis]|uniref:chitinase endochitinase 1 precursor n=1 Tax=Scheffersomyces coipomensis TaxID=1788519 RepID=UPI00315DBF4A
MYVGSDPGRHQRDDYHRPQQPIPLSRKPSAASEPPLKFNNCVYFSNWSIYDRKHFATDLPFNSITHVFYAFMKINADTGSVELSDSWADKEIPLPSVLIPQGKAKGSLLQFLQLKTKYRHVNVIMSVGGWGTHELFESLVGNPVKLEKFVTSCMKFVMGYGFDGIDIDWEYPKTEAHAETLLLIIQKLYDRITNICQDSGSPPLSISIAAPGGSENIKVLKLEKMAEYLSFWNVMCYDFNGEGWSEKTGYQSNLYGFSGCNNMNVDNVIRQYLDAGISPRKLHLGMPLYGRVFHGVKNPLLGNSFTKQKVKGCVEQDTVDFNKLPIGIETYYPLIGAVSCYDSRLKQLIVYDNKQTISMKANYTKRNNLGGGMWWDSAGDKKGEDSLIKSYLHDLGGTVVLNKEENHPASFYKRK